MKTLSQSREKAIVQISTFDILWVLALPAVAIFDANADIPQPKEVPCVHGS